MKRLVICLALAWIAAPSAYASEASIQACIPDEMNDAHLDAAHARQNCICQQRKLQQTVSSQDFELYVKSAELKSQNLDRSIAQYKIKQLFDGYHVNPNDWLNRMRPVGEHFDQECRMAH